MDAVLYGCSIQYAVEKWYMVMGTLSLVEKSQTSGCSGHSTQWMQYAVEAVRTGIVVYGGGDIVFGA